MLKSSISIKLFRCAYHSTSKISSSAYKCQFSQANFSEKEEESSRKVASTVEIAQPGSYKLGEVIQAARVLPMLTTNKEPVVLPFDSVPGPKSLKYLSNFRQYISEFGTQLTAAALTSILNVGSFISKRKSLKSLSTLFDEYGPVVRFVSPVGGNVVLITHPEHIRKVFTSEGEFPVRSTLDSLEKYRKEHKSHIYGGLYNVQGIEWDRHKNMVTKPLYYSMSEHTQGLLDISETFVQKIYNLRNHQDEIPKDLYKEVHKWAFDSVCLIIFSKRFNILESDVVSSQCDESWLYHSFSKATEAIIRCETGFQFWKVFATPAWNTLVKYCDSFDSLIGKYVLESEQAMAKDCKLLDGKAIEPEGGNRSLITSMMLSEDKLGPEDITTILMDMLLLGINTISSSMTFLTFFLAKHQRCQKILHGEIVRAYPHSTISVEDVAKIKDDTPYLQACIKETLRLVPPIPVLTRILPKNIILDRYNIPRGTLIMISTLETFLREANYDEAERFCPERWLKDEAKDYHSFASIPFGSGTRKCLGQNIAETMLSVLTAKLIQKFKLEYHYGDIQPTRSFIARPNKQVKIRFIDRV